jgi:hypothetical protein
MSDESGGRSSDIVLADGSTVTRDDGGGNGNPEEMGSMMGVGNPDELATKL